MNSSAWTGEWPDDVLHRYLTTAGRALADPTVTVDVYWSPGHIPHDQDQTLLTISASCLACLATTADSYTNTPVAHLHDLRNSNYPREVRAWAQQHADECSALPRPELTR